MRTPPAGTVPFGGTIMTAMPVRPGRNPRHAPGGGPFYRGERDGLGHDHTRDAGHGPAQAGVRSDIEIYLPALWAAATGNGLMTQYGLVGVASITDEFHAWVFGWRIFQRDHGWHQTGEMQGSGPQIKVRDRWAIVASFALMRSQNARVSDVPETPSRGAEPMTHTTPSLEGDGSPTRAASLSSPFSWWARSASRPSHCHAGRSPKRWLYSYLRRPFCRYHQHRCPGTFLMLRT